MRRRRRVIVIFPLLPLLLGVGIVGVVVPTILGFLVPLPTHGKASRLSWIRNRLSVSTLFSILPQGLKYLGRVHQYFVSNNGNKNVSNDGESNGRVEARVAE